MSSLDQHPPTSSTAALPPADSLLAELAARSRGALPARPIWGDRVRWGGRLYHVDTGDDRSAVLCPYLGCSPVSHEHLHLGPLGLTFLRWDADVREFRQYAPHARARAVAA